MKCVITNNENDWKFEITIFKNKIRYVRLKIYCKTLEFLTQCGVENFSLKDPLALLLFGKNFLHKLKKFSYKN